MSDQSPAAFARPRSADPEDFHNPETYHAQEGMTLRDYFAAKALPVAMTTPWSDIGYAPENGLTDIQQHARLAYQIADAMLVERAK